MSVSNWLCFEAHGAFTVFVQTKMWWCLDAVTVQCRGVSSCVCLTSADLHPKLPERRVDGGEFTDRQNMLIQDNLSYCVRGLLVCIVLYSRVVVTEDPVVEGPGLVWV